MKREIEKKYLIADQDARDKLVAGFKDQFSQMEHTGTKTVISYFYKMAERDQILAAGTKLLDTDQLKDLTYLLDNTDEQIVKCRSVDDRVEFAVKGSPKGEDPVHAADRLEFEVVLDTELETINEALVSAGIELVSKWSSTREFYNLDADITANIEFVSGYGHKAEIEMLVEEGDSTAEALQQIDRLAESVGLQPATDALMGRMYNYYNQHWPEFFNTKKTFSPETWELLRKEA